MKTKFILVLLLFIRFTTIGQTIVSDSKGNEMYNFYTGNSFTGEMETAKEEIKFNYNLPFKRYFFYVGEAKDTTVTASVDIQMGLKIFDNTEKINFAKLNDSKFGFEFNIGIQRAIDKIVNPTLIKDNKIAFGSYGGSFYIRKDNFLLFDPRTSKITQENPVNFGININATGYKWSFMASQFSANIGFKKYNVDDLSSYFLNSPLYSNSEIIAFSSDAAGKYGELKSSKFYQIRLSNPFFPFVCLDNFLNKIAIVPYLTTEITDIESPKYRYGIMLNLLGESVSQTKSYKISKGYGIGIDRTNKDSQPILFMRGTFNFGEINKDKRKGFDHLTKK